MTNPHEVGDAAPCIDCGVPLREKVRMGRCSACYSY
jgi:hypothetical protein